MTKFVMDPVKIASGCFPNYIVAKLWTGSSLGGNRSIFRGWGSEIGNIQILRNPF